MQRRGVQGSWEPFYSAERTAGLFREMLSREGYYFYEEGTDDGLIYTLFKGEETFPGAQVDWAGGLESAVPEDQFVQDYVARVRQEIEEAEGRRSLQGLSYS
jgi:hypothetical protein